ncbi:MAG: hypothetical protein ACLSE6_00495 [Alphaproteobacteria bacterium]
MSNKLLLAASVFAISLSLANAASASCDGPYLAVRGGVTNHSLGDKDENVATDKKLDVDDNAMMFSGAIGYRWGYFRVEAVCLSRRYGRFQHQSNSGYSFGFRYSALGGIFL